MGHRCRLAAHVARRDLRGRRRRREPRVRPRRRSARARCSRACRRRFGRRSRGRPAARRCRSANARCEPIPQRTRPCRRGGRATAAHLAPARKRMRRSCVRCGRRRRSGGARTSPWSSRSSQRPRASAAVSARTAAGRHPGRGRITPPGEGSTRPVHVVLDCGRASREPLRYARSRKIEGRPTGCGAAVAHLLWEQGVGSSSLPTPTTLSRHEGRVQSCSFLHTLQYDAERERAIADHQRDPEPRRGRPRRALGHDGPDEPLQRSPTGSERLVEWRSTRSRQARFDRTRVRSPRWLCAQPRPRRGGARSGAHETLEHRPRSDRSGGRDVDAATQALSLIHI